MATYRIGIGSFNLKDGAVGIGTESTGLGNLKVEGTYKTTDLDVTGVSTFTRYAGFVADDININRDTSLTGEHSTQGDIVVGLNSTFTVSTGATVTVGAVESVSIGTHFSPPTGDINDRPEVPVEGTVRFNKDLNTLEFYNGFEWRQFTVNSASGRGLIAGGVTGGSIDYATLIGSVQIMSQGNEVSFGDLTQARGYSNSVSSGTRGVFGGGAIFPAGATPFSNVIDYVIIQSGGNAADFGDLTDTKQWGAGGCSSSTRGLFSSRYPHQNVIEYIEINTLGNSIDFGDKTVAAAGAPAAVASPTRGMWAGGYTNPGDLGPSTISQIDVVTIANKGNAIRFGDLTERKGSMGGCSTPVRGVYGGGQFWPNTALDTVEFITLASEGKGINFGNLTVARGFGAATSTATRGIFGGMRVQPAINNIIDFISMQSGGTAIDFGDLSISRKEVGMTSDSHGGLGGY